VPHAVLVEQPYSVLEVLMAGHAEAEMVKAYSVWVEPVTRWRHRPQAHEHVPADHDHTAKEDLKDLVRCRVIGRRRLHRNRETEEAGIELTAPLHVGHRKPQVMDVTSRNLSGHCALPPRRAASAPHDRPSGQHRSRSDPGASASASSFAAEAPPVPRFPLPDGHVWLWGAEVAIEMGDGYLGLEHALLAMIRSRETVPARALAGLADLDALEASVLEAKNAPPAGPPEDAVFLPEGQPMDSALRQALAGALPEGTTFGFNSDAAGRRWMHLIGPGDARSSGRNRPAATAGGASRTRRDAPQTSCRECHRQRAADAT
jgi:hypothetical protein